MIITLEGCDGAGKTTLIDQLAAMGAGLGLDVFRMARGKPTSDDPFIEYEADLIPYRPNLHQLVLCDRWAWGEMIYGPRFRGHSILDMVGMRHIDLLLRSRGALQVYLDLPNIMLEQRVRERGDQLITPAAVAEITDQYGALTASIGPHVVWVDSRQPRAAESIMQMARMATEDASYLPRTETYVGPVCPEILLVGESRGSDPPPPGSLPAFVPRPATSGYYLMAALEGIGLINYGMVNALEDDVLTLWADMNRPQTVALGTTAHHVLERNHIPHGAVPHPQYVRRFHHSRSEEYAQMIQKAAETGSRLWLR